MCPVDFYFPILIHFLKVNEVIISKQARVVLTGRNNIYKEARFCQIAVSCSVLISRIHHNPSNEINEKNCVIITAPSPR